jgi:hypothetical protein
MQSRRARARACLSDHSVIFSAVTSTTLSLVVDRQTGSGHSLLRRRSGTAIAYACTSRAPASRSDTNSISTRSATVSLPAMTEIQTHRLRDGRAQRLLARVRPLAQPRDQRRRQPDREHQCALVDRHTIRALDRPRSHIDDPAAPTAHARPATPAPRPPASDRPTTPPPDSPGPRTRPHTLGDWPSDT